MNELKLFRCTIIGENDKYFIGKDVLDNKLFIAKNRNTRKYKIGTDDSFYASIKLEGLLVKKEVLHPISSDEYEKIASDRKVYEIDEDILEKIKNI